MVDAPANEKEFAVIKKKLLEEKNMAEAATQDTTSDDAQRVAVDVDSGEFVAKALESVNEIVGRIESITKSAAKAEGKTDDTSTDDVDVDKADESIQSVLEKAGLKGDAMKAAVDNLTKAGFDPKKPFPGAKSSDKKKAEDKKAEDDAKKKTTKAADDASDDASDDDASTDDAIDNTPLTMDGLVDAVAKAAAFTPARVAKLKEAADILKLVLEAIAPNATPKTRVPAVDQHSLGNATAVLTKADEQVLKAIKNLGGLVEGLGERVEGIEKARNASNSVDDDGDTDKGTVDTEKAIWKGIL